MRFWPPNLAHQYELERATEVGILDLKEIMEKKNATSERHVFFEKVRQALQEGFMFFKGRF